jgi:thiamine kinase-like enzyme
MNLHPPSTHIEILCDALELGDLLTPPTPVTGGFHHTLWQLRTGRGEYALKQLSADTDLQQPAVVEHYNQSEATATRFKALGIPAVAALPDHDKYLHLIEQNGYLLYPWQSGRAVKVAEISDQHIATLVPIIARMHGAKLQVEGVGRPDIQIHSQQTIQTHVERAVKQQIAEADALLKALPSLLKIATAHQQGLAQLESHRVISHGDLDAKNVLWTQDMKPVIIDWESSRQLNPTYEILQVALDWSGIGEQWHVERFKQVILAYQRAGATLDRDRISVAIDCLCGDWLNWLIYNVDRACDVHQDLRPLGASQLALVLPILLRIYATKPEILRILSRC